MDKNIRIAIIGGGPAGLSAGMYLEQKGYENYVIYEKSDHVGGKCHSPFHNGKRYEMGAIMGVPSYYAVHDIEVFAGITHDGPALNRDYQKPNGKMDHQFSTKRIWNLPHLLKLKKQIEKFGEILRADYKGYDICGHRGVSEGRYEGYAVAEDRHHVEGENPKLKDLCMTFKDFTDKLGVPLVREVWIQPFTSFGYGYFDEIPAAYVLKYLDFQTMMNFMHVNLWTWKDGTQSIYEALNAKLKHPALLEQNIEKVVRSEEGVVLTVNGKEEKFDKLIVTAPLQYFPEYADADEEEKELFSKIDYERYDTMAFLTDPENYPDRSRYIVDYMTPETLGHVMVYYHRWPESDQPLVTYVLRKHKNSKELDYEATKEQVKKDMEALGCPMKEIINEGKWYYFPHVFAEDYAAGWYEKVEAKQGNHSTYYAGEIMAFGDMDETVEYSRDLIERFF